MKDEIRSKSQNNSFDDVIDFNFEDSFFESKKELEEEEIYKPNENDLSKRLNTSDAIIDYDVYNLEFLGNLNEEVAHKILTQSKENRFDKQDINNQNYEILDTNEGFLNNSFTISQKDNQPTGLNKKKNISESTAEKTPAKKESSMKKKLILNEKFQELSPYTNNNANTDIYPTNSIGSDNNDNNEIIELERKKEKVLDQDNNDELSKEVYKI